MSTRAALQRHLLNRHALRVSGSDSYALLLLFVAQKGTKNALETGRTFATLFADTDLRVRLLGARTENDFKRLLWEQMKELAEEQQYSSGSKGRKLSEDSTDEKAEESTPTPVSLK